VGLKLELNWKLELKNRVKENHFSPIMLLDEKKTSARQNFSKYLELFFICHGSLLGRMA
jgi:hypothetical protein